MAAGRARAELYDDAVAVAPSADNLARLAAQLLAERRYADAERAARAALRRSPIQVRAVRVLGLAQLAQGRVQDSVATMNLAARGGWRDTPTQGWVIQAALADGDYETAAQRLDGLIRRDALRGPGLVALRASLNEPGMRSALVERLADSPDWKALLFLELRNTAPAEIPGALALFKQAGKAGVPVGSRDVAPMVERLLELQQVAPARALWADHASRKGWKFGNLLYDGSFDVAQAGVGLESAARFEWRIDGPDGSAAFGRGPGGAHLRLSANGDAAATLARQVLALAPGSYQLTARVSTSTPFDRAGYAINMACVPGNGGTIVKANGGFAVDPAGGGVVRQIFTVPADNCPRQDLSFDALPGRTTTIETVMVSNVALRPGSP